MKICEGRTAHVMVSSAPTIPKRMDLRQGQVYRDKDQPDHRFKWMDPEGAYRSRLIPPLMISFPR